MAALKQIATIVAMNTRAIRARYAASLVVVLGMAAVVAVSLSILSMSAGVMSRTRENNSPELMVVLSKGAANEGSSNIPRDAVPVIADTPGVAKGVNGKPLISTQLMMPVYVRKKVNGIETIVIVRGTSPNLQEINPALHIVEGRMFTPGLHELIVGQTAAVRFEKLNVGDDVRLPDGPWKIVGMFEATKAPGGDIGMMADADTLMSVMRRNGFNILNVRLTEGTKRAQDQFADTLRSNPALSVDVETAQSYGSRNLKNFVQFYTALAYGVGGIMGLGALFAALNTMYAAVSARTTEIATLRAIGFGSSAVVFSVFVEAFILAVSGAVIGAALSWSIFNGHRQELGFLSVVQEVTPTMFAAGIVLSLVVGAIGALFPAIRAARLPVATALQVR